MTLELLYIQDHFLTVYTMYEVSVYRVNYCSLFAHEIYVLHDRKYSSLAKYAYKYPELKVLQSKTFKERVLRD